MDHKNECGLSKLTLCGPEWLADFEATVIPLYVPLAKRKKKKRKEKKKENLGP